MLRSRVSARFFLPLCLGAVLCSGALRGAAQTPQERLQELETALQRQPEDVPTLVALGRLYADSERLPEGLTLLEKATALAPKNPTARAWLGNLQVQMARTTEDVSQRLLWVKRGTKTLDEAVEDFPTEPVVYIVRGINGVHQPEQFKRYGQSIQDLQRVVEMHRQDPGAVPDTAMPMVYLYLGLAYKKNQQRAEARATWEQGRQRYPQAREAARMQQELHNL